jgi:hypothetical protein
MQEAKMVTPVRVLHSVLSVPFLLGVGSIGRAEADPPPASRPARRPAGAGGRADTLVQIASWPIAGNIQTGGQLHAWDLNGNQIPDLCTSNWRDSTYIFEAIADNELVLKRTLANPAGSYWTKLLCAGDADGDGLAELVYGSGTSGIPRSLFVVEARQAGMYPDSVVLVLSEQNIGVNHMKIGDLDGDGRGEYIGTTRGTHQKLLAIWENRGDNAFAQVFSAHFGVSNAVSDAFALGDFDGDGRGDLVVPCSGVTTDLHVLECTGDDAYSVVWTRTIAPTRAIVWATAGPDLDLDGRSDFIVTYIETGSGGDYCEFLMYETAGDNAYEQVWSHLEPVSWSGFAGAATGDVGA